MNNKQYWIALSIIGVVAAFLRFWNIGELQSLVFDEVYFPKFGLGYITGKEFFDTHPPLSKYIIGIGIWIHNHLPWVSDPSYKTAEIEQLSAISWRWMNAVFGTALCFIVARVSLYLHPSKVLALIFAAFIATDGTFVVESRFGLNNIYIVFFGACSLLFFAKMLQQPKSYRLPLALCGVFLGLTYSVKWNGLGYSLAIWGLLIAPSLILFINRFATDSALEMHKHERAKIFNQIKLWEYPAYLVVLPFIVYSLVWQPHLSLWDNYGFMEMQRQIIGYHSNGVEADAHPYCSSWYSWPVLERPISYYFLAEDDPINAGKKIYYDVHLLGNPILFWFSALAMIGISMVWFVNLMRWFRSGKAPNTLLIQSVIVFGFFANWLPWSIVSRCLFQYHFMPASLFSIFAAAWFVAQGFEAKAKWPKYVSSVIVLAIFFGFIYWLPIQLGLPLSTESYYERMLFSSWI